MEKHTQSQTVNNAIITLGDIDDSGKGKRFKSRFIQPGLAGYPGQFGSVLVRKETIDNSLNTIIGAPVIINHKDITKDNADDERVGVISNAYYNEKDGWYWCDGVIWDETAQNLITDKKWSVSCSYDFLEEDDAGGSENNIPYDREFTKLNFVHLAIVDNPRYERANIVFNSKTQFTEKEHQTDKIPDVHNIKEHEEMTLLEELKKLITKVEIDKGENMDDSKEIKNGSKATDRDVISLTDVGEGGEKNGSKDDPEKDEELNEAENKKCNNSVDNSNSKFFDRLNEVYNSCVDLPQQNVYVTRADRLKAAEEYFS